MIFRRRHTANFTTISNRLFDDENLAADEIGILAFLLSRPDNWEVRRPALARRFGVGPVAIKRVIRSWMRAGWCVATKVRLPNGTFCVLYDIHDMPGEEMTDDQVTEALSHVTADSGSDEPPHVSDDPPPPSPPAGEPLVADDGVALYKDITRTELPNPDLQNSERELARAREKHALGLAEFKRRWPDIANDDQVKIDNAWFALEFDEGEAALAGIVPFLDNLKRKGKKYAPASFNYLSQKRWALLEQTKAIAPATTVYPPDSDEAKAIKALHLIAGRTSAFFQIWRRADGTVNFPKAMTPQLLALAHVPDTAEWVDLAANQAAAWESLLDKFFDVGVTRTHPRAGSKAPWPWPPSTEGKIYTPEATPPPTQLGELSDQDAADFR